MPHRGNEKVSDVHTGNRANADANFLAFRHAVLLPVRWVGLALAAKEFLAPAQFLVLVLAHFLSAFLEHTSHAVPLLRGGV